MSKELEAPANDQSSFMNFKTIHVVAEIAVVCGVAIYFYRRVESLVSKIAELEERLDANDKILQTHEEVLKKISLRLNSSVKKTQPISRPSRVEPPSSTSHPETPPETPPQMDMLNLLGLLGGSAMFQRQPPPVHEERSFIQELPENTQEKLDIELRDELEDLENT